MGRSHSKQIEVIENNGNAHKTENETGKEVESGADQEIIPKKTGKKSKKDKGKIQKGDASPIESKSDRKSKKEKHKVKAEKSNASEKSVKPKKEKKEKKQKKNKQKDSEPPPEDETDKGILKNAGLEVSGETEKTNGSVEPVADEETPHEERGDGNDVDQQLEIAEFNAALQAKLPLGADPGDPSTSPEDKIISLQTAKKTDSLTKRHSQEFKRISEEKVQQADQHVPDEPVKLRRKKEPSTLDTETGDYRRSSRSSYSDMQMLPPMSDARRSRSMENLIFDKLTEHGQHVHSGNRSPRGSPRGSTSDLRFVDRDARGRPISWGGPPLGASPRGSPRGSRRGSTADLRVMDRDSRGRPISWGGPRGNSPRASPRASPRGSPRASPRGSPRASPRGSPRGSPKGSTSDYLSMGRDARGRPLSWGGAPPGSSPRASPRGSPRGSTSDLRVMDRDSRGRPISWGGPPSPSIQRRGSTSSQISQTSQDRRRVEHLRGIRESRLPEGLDMLTYQLEIEKRNGHHRRSHEDLSIPSTDPRRARSMEDLTGGGRRQPWETSPRQNRRKKPMGIWARTQMEGS